MTAQELARRLHAKRSGRGWEAKCPAHHDKRASLSISEGNDGRILMKCHRGCTVDAVCGALGVTLADLHVTTANGDGRLNIIAEYDYRDEHGTLASQVVRLDPKDFRQCKPNGAGGWNGQPRAFGRFCIT
jgi:putative DNA primase/helicase